MDHYYGRGIMGQPCVAVVIPVYNAEATILEALTSIDRQSFRNFLIIAVDDGSTDSSFTLLQEFATTRDNVIVLTQSNHGELYSRNRGIRYAQEHGIPFIAFLDADDTWHRQKLAWQMRAFEMYPDASLVIVRQQYYGRSAAFNTTPQWDGRKIRRFEHLFESLCRNDFTFHPASYVARSAVFNGACFYDERFPCGGDFPLFLYFGYENINAIYIDVPLYFQRALPDSLQRKPSSVYHGYRGRVAVIGELLASARSDPRMTAERVSVLLEARDKYMPGVVYGARRYLPYLEALIVAARAFGGFRDKRASLIELVKTILWPLTRFRSGASASGLRPRRREWVAKPARHPG